MRFEYFGLTKMLAVLAPFALALSFVGCSGESSTAADGNSDDQENSAIDDDSSGKDSSSSSSKKGGSSGKDGSSSSSKKASSSSKDGSSSSSKKGGSSGKDGSSSSSKKGGSSGKNGSSSSSKKAGSSGKDSFANVSVPDVKIGECNFKEDDEVWGFAYTHTEDDETYETYSFTFFDGKNLKDSLYNIYRGPETTKECEQMTGKQEIEDDLLDAKIVSTQWCENGAMYAINVANYGNTYNMSRESLFEMAMDECTKLNGVSANSAGRSSSSSAGGSASVSTCNFKKTDDVWVMDVAGVGRTTVTWSGNSYTAVAEMNMRLKDEETCEESVENADPDDHAYCEGSVYKSRAERVVDDADRDEIYEEVMALCSM